MGDGDRNCNFQLGHFVLRPFIVHNLQNDSGKINVCMRRTRGLRDSFNMRPLFAIAERRRSHLYGLPHHHIFFDDRS